MHRVWESLETYFFRESNMQTTEISIFRPNSRQKEATITAPVPRACVNALSERLGVEAGQQAQRALRTMRAQGIDLLQFRIGDQRVRIKQSD
jgi:hypothetical protein